MEELQEQILNVVTPELEIIQENVHALKKVVQEIKDKPDKPAVLNILIANIKSINTNA